MGVPHLAAAPAENRLESLATAHLPLVARVVQRLSFSLPHFVDREELYSLGIMGLIDAARRYDPQAGVAFSTYATPRIRGSILDGLRAEQWAPHLQRHSRQIEEVEGRLASALGRYPTDEEVAQALGLSVDTLTARRRDAVAGILLRLDSPQDESAQGSLAETLVDRGVADPLQEALRSERRQVVIESLGRLSEREQQVLHLIYYQGCTPKEAARALRVSDSYVYRLHDRAILRLRGSLGRHKHWLMQEG